MTDEQRTKVIDAELILGRLRELHNIKIGDPTPKWLEGFLWLTALSQLAGDAADLRWG